MQRKKLIGLRPYLKEENDYFYGRDREVERLLQILQKDKLVTLIGLQVLEILSHHAGLIPDWKGFCPQV